MYKNNKIKTTSEYLECEEFIIKVVRQAGLDDIEERYYLEVFDGYCKRGLSLVLATKNTLEEMIDSHSLNINFKYREYLYVCYKLIK